MPRIRYVSALPPRTARPPTPRDSPKTFPAPGVPPDYLQRRWPLDPAQINWGAWLPKPSRPVRGPAISPPREIRPSPNLGLDARRSTAPGNARARDLRERLRDACVALDQEHCDVLFAFVLELAAWTTEERRQRGHTPPVHEDWSAASWIASPLEFDELESWRELGFRNLLVESTQSPGNHHRYADAVEDRIQRAEELGFRVVTSVDIYVPESRAASAPDRLRRIPVMATIQQMLVGVAYEVAEGAMGIRAAEVDRWYSPLPDAKAEAKTHALLSIIKIFLRMTSSKEVLYADEGAAFPTENPAKDADSEAGSEVSLKYLGSEWHEESTSSEGDLLTGADIDAFIEATEGEADPEDFVNVLTQFDEPLFHGHLLHTVTSAALRRLILRPWAGVCLKSMFLLPGTLRFEGRALGILASRPDVQDLLRRLNDASNVAPNLWSAQVEELILPTKARHRAFIKSAGPDQILAVLNLEDRPLHVRWRPGIDGSGGKDFPFVSDFGEEAILQIGAHVEIRAPRSELSIWMLP